jgi:chromosome segregation ATPase
MSDNMNNGFDQVASFQKLWADSFVNMAGVWSQFSPGSPPPDEMRKMRGGMLKVLAETWDEYMRTPQFMEMMKASLNGALDLKRMARDGMNRVHEQFETPSKEDIDGVLLAIRHVEGRLLDRVEGVDDRVLNLAEKIDKIDQRIANQENAIDKRLANLAESIGKIDQRIANQENAIDKRLANLAESIGKIDQRTAKQENAIDKRLANLAESIDKIGQRIAKQKNTIGGPAQTSKTKAQKPAASTGAKQSPSE